jgi:hypothetical protein
MLTANYRRFFPPEIIEETTPPSRNYFLVPYSMVNQFNPPGIMVEYTNRGIKNFTASVITLSKQ